MIHVCYSGQHDDSILQLKGLWFHPELENVRIFTCASLFLCRFFWVLRFTLTSHKPAGMWIDNTKLPLGMNECVTMWW